MGNNGSQVPVIVTIESTGHVNDVIGRKLKKRFDFYRFYRDMAPDPANLMVIVVLVLVLVLVLVFCVGVGVGVSVGVSVSVSVSVSVNIVC